MFRPVGWQIINPWRTVCRDHHLAASRQTNCSMFPELQRPEGDWRHDNLHMPQQSGAKPGYWKVYILLQYWMIYRGPGFLAVVAFCSLYPSPPPPPSASFFLSQSSCVSPFARLLRGGGLGEDTNHQDGEKAWPSLNHLLLSVLLLKGGRGQAKPTSEKLTWPKCSESIPLWLSAGWSWKRRRMLGWDVNQ